MHATKSNNNKIKNDSIIMYHENNKSSSEKFIESIYTLVKLALVLVLILIYKDAWKKAWKNKKLGKIYFIIHYSDTYALPFIVGILLGK